MTSVQPIAETVLTHWPRATEVEQSLLALLLTNKDAIANVVGEILIEEMYNTPHQFILAAMFDLFEMGEAVDIISVSEILKDNGKLDIAGGRSYICDLAVSETLDINRIEWALRTIRDKAIARNTMKISFETIGSSSSLSGQEMLEALSTKVYEVSNLISTKFKRTSDIAREAKRSLKLAMKGEYPGRAPCGFNCVDEILNGFGRNELIILAARPGMGKSALALNISCNLGIRQRKPVLIFSMEMSDEQMVQRMITSESETNVNTSKIDETEIPNRIVIHETPGLTIGKLRSIVVKTRMEYPELSMIVVDHLGLMHSEGETQHLRIGKLTKALKQISMEFKIPVLCLTQLSRALESRQDKRPMLSDLRDSGNIEEDADIVMFIYRDGYYDKASLTPYDAEIIVAKNRSGKIGKTVLVWRGNITKFVEVKNGKTV